MEIPNQHPPPWQNTSDWMNESMYLTRILGPKHLPLKLVIPITLVYAVIFVTGVIGNVATCIVIRRNPVMQTATNYYLFNLAVSDLLLLILGLPNELSIFWQQYPWKFGLIMCKIRAYVSETSSYVSVLTIVAFSLERYLAICHPLHLYAMSGLKRPMRVILFAWLIALIFAMPFAVYTTVNFIEYPPRSGRPSKESAVCAMMLNNMPAFPLYEMSCLIFFLLPMMFIAVLYVRMGLRIQNNTLDRSIEGSVHGGTRQAHSRKTIIRMLSAVVITFFICWAPFHAQRLLYVYQVPALGDINDWLYPLAGCLYYFSTIANPILYNVMSAKYRHAFEETLCCSSGSPSFTREDLSSTRDTTVCGGSSRRESQMIRVRSVHNQRSVKGMMPEHSKETFRSSGRYRSEEEEEDRQRTIGANNTSIRNTNTSAEKPASVEAVLPGQKKPSFVVQTGNGWPKCQTAEKELRNPSSETHI